jgi:ribosomal protein S18 acetylase RimI-like enzyme
MIIVPSIRFATTADSRTIAEMSREYIEEGLGWSWTQARVSKAIRDPATNVVIAHEDGVVLGFGIMRYGERKAHLVLLGVRPSRRKHGLGALLVGWLEKCALVAGLERIDVEARSDNPAALAFYAEQGFLETGTVPGYYRGLIDAVRLQKKLREPDNKVC